MTAQTWLGVVVLTGSGLTAGVLYAVALSVVPAFRALSPQRYVETHKLIGRRFDLVMPPTVLTWTVGDVVAAVLTGHPVVRLLLLVAAAAGCAVAVVSQLGNVPINRRVKALPAGALPPHWPDPRAHWRAFNLLRTGFAVLGLVANAAAVSHPSW
ncbi:MULTISPECIES: anthrone oxygenase family protein [unclassified Solwaraspora]|uniref:anthrone oxygenase family protein n=1 Tax=unclassified Solwaraspora TaxID=2627926 RepID=UPI00259B1985|nr:anthrone oxygenase family protein [Solwaraspora sp. WMMA2056]WJK38253.1 DUF1772 domain-containing protein [Solwaraspora sp. WMMA2056]